MPSLVPLLWDTLLKGAAILLLVGLGTNLLRRSAASTRYHIWILALVAVFFLPLMTVLVPDTTLTVIRKYPLSTPMVTEPPRAAPPSIRPLNPLPSPSEVVPPQAPSARTKIRVNEGRLRQHAPVLSVGAWFGWRRAHCGVAASQSTGRRVDGKICSSRIGPGMDHHRDPRRQIAEA